MAIEGFEGAADALIDSGNFLYGRGLVPATSGNFSARLSDELAAITVSGAHKGRLRREQIMVVDMDGQPWQCQQHPSAETALHTMLYRRFPEVGCVLHTHSVNATVLSKGRSGELLLEDYEVVKAFTGIGTHEARFVVPIFPNTQDIDALAVEVEAYMDSHPPIHGYLIAGHGLYTWGSSVEDTLRHIEAFEFLFECELVSQRVKGQ